MHAGAEAAYPLRPQPRLDRGRARRIDPAFDRLCRGAAGARGPDYRKGRVRGNARRARVNLFGLRVFSKLSLPGLTPQVGFTRFAAHILRNSGKPELRCNPSIS